MIKYRQRQMQISFQLLHKQLLFALAGHRLYC